MKKIIFTLIVCISAVTAKAQIGYNYGQYDLGFGVGYNKVMSDLGPSDPKASFHVNFTYNQTPFVNFIVEGQIGSVATKPFELFPGTFLNFDVKYTTVAFKAQLQAGELIDYSTSGFNNFLKNIYISGGVGVIYTDYNLYDETGNAGEQKGSNIFIPVKAGYEIKIFNSYNEPNTKLDLGYQLNYIMSDNFDGLPYGKFNDAIGQFVIGLKFSIGGRTSYRKPISF